MMSAVSAVSAVSAMSVMECGDERNDGKKMRKNLRAILCMHKVVRIPRVLLYLPT